ncbi:magnesium and cobalt transport protein CorA [Aldersonia sp. NBC_00410]|uniref:magnesium and cobalt transport protein CorA n=1 Tax=Aldersonia sp. NBC_00410 TaxID=2975954 RepID=UPI00225788B3|nr:magnesium and cobalt transport protein CorA [Aldersonia sp. NBC_00410]MCX5043730.1 magnesium and cobalt transport protein CorA [Aldersonia sp. NBC_00410]
MPSLPALPSIRTQGRPAGAPPRVRVPASEAVVDCAVYRDGHRLRGRYSHAAALDEVREHGTGFAWVGLHEPDENQMAVIAETYGLHELTVEDAVHAHQRPKLERYDDLLFMVLRTVKYVEHDLREPSEIVETGEIMIFMGPDFVVTVRHGDHTQLAGVRRRLEADPDQLEFGPSAVLHAIADHVVDTYLNVTTELERDVDEMEEEVFTPGGDVPIDAIYQLKREIVELRRSVTPLAVPLQSLARGAAGSIPKEVRRYLRDVSDHHATVSERITEFDEALSALVDTAIAKIAMRQNTDMRKISAWVAIAAVPTMVAGIYGMNFDNMPELHWTYGYPFIGGIVAVICAGLFFTFRRNHWL